MNKNPRTKREVKTIETMIGMYCHDIHNTRYGDLCSDCRELLDYAKVRLENCPFREDKTTCAKCPVHCYKSDKREKIRIVMRHAGPKMIFRHPVLALFHSIDGLRKEPVSTRGRSGKK
jgi:hypothetical protein